MSKKLIAAVSIRIDAPIEDVWKGITDPAMIKQYLFGTDTTTDWKKGSPITYRGVWEGKPYEDKGTIIDIVPNKLLHTTYYSPMSGKEDKPENYNNVIYDLKVDHGHSIVTLTQDNIDSEEQLLKMEQNWGMVLDGMKKTVEKQSHTVS